jgi:hypothetical protein
MADEVRRRPEQFDFKVRDLLITQLPTRRFGAGDRQQCDSITGGHPVHTDFCGFPSDTRGYPPPDLRELKGIVRLAAAHQATDSIEQSLRPLDLEQIGELENLLTGALDGLRAQREVIEQQAQG